MEIVRLETANPINTHHYNLRNFSLGVYHMIKLICFILFLFSQALLPKHENHLDLHSCVRTIPN